MAGQEQPNQQLKLAYWFVTRRIFLRKLLVGFLIAFIVITFGFSFWRLIRLYLIDYDEHRRLLLELPLDLVNYQGFKEVDQPRGLAVLSTTLIPTSQQKYDLVVKISNPNPKWYVEFDYQFLGEGLKSKKQHGFILPGEEKFLIELAVESTRLVRQPILDLKNLKWRKILNFEPFRKDRYNFKIEDLAFVPAALTEVTKKLPVSKSTFKITNQSVYNFWQVGLYVVLFTGNRITGANYIILEQFKSGQTIPVEINWFETLGNVTKTEVLPEVNILNRTVYFGFEGDKREEFRTVPRGGFF